MIPRPFYIAHRGASGHEPENTLLSFSRALELGASWVEFDVRVVEGEPIVFHDRSLQRMANVPGVVEKQTLKRIRSLKLAKDQSIPLLSEVLDLLRGKACAQIELKGVGSGVVTALALLKALQEGWDASRFLVSSFDHSELLAFRVTAPVFPIGLLTYGYPMACVENAQKIGAVSVHLHLDAVTEDRVKQIHAAGLKVFVYTVNDPADMRELATLGVDGIFTDFPERAVFLSGDPTKRAL
jgi:glycerophosphoryl diester phosphodiesterase